MTCLLGFFVPLKVPEGEDTLCWKEDRRGISSVKSYYCSLSGENNFLFPKNEACRSCALLRTCFFAWEAIGGRY